jgi:hypothetical protein
MEESHGSPPYFQHLLAPTSHPIYKVMLINQVLVDSVLRTNYLTLTHVDGGVKVVVQAPRLTLPAQQNCVDIFSAITKRERPYPRLETERFLHQSVMLIACSVAALEQWNIVAA